MCSFSTQWRTSGNLITVLERFRPDRKFGQEAAGIERPDREPENGNRRLMEYPPAARRHINPQGASYQNTLKPN